MTVGCVNPARPGATDWVPLDSYWYTRSSLPVPGGPIQLVDRRPATDALRAHRRARLRQMHQRGPRGYLWIRTNHKPGEKWTDHIGGEVAVLGMFLPGWGMHLADMSEAQGDLIREVGDDYAAGARAAERGFTAGLRARYRPRR